MKILVIGSGGREHALVWKLAQSPRVKKIYCAPGNPGMIPLAELVPVSGEDLEGLKSFALREMIDLTIVGPEAPLSLGVVDCFQKAGLRIFGPNQKASILESSKIFTKEFCARHDIPTAPFAVFTDPLLAKKYLEEKNQYPIVIKADGLAQGKGVVVASHEKKALEAVDSMLLSKQFGDSGTRIVIEDFMPGEEATFMVLCDGEQFLCLDTAQDHKRVFDQDQGPNTGGMGAYSPAPIVTEVVREQVIRKIIQPTLDGMKKEGNPYVGILYAGLMIDGGEVRLVEFNCRFGDPEAEVILFRLQTDLVDLVEAALDQKLKNTSITFDAQPAVCVVLASQGYPENYPKGVIIHGFESIVPDPDFFIFHAGTALKQGQWVTAGGRVLMATARAENLPRAIENVYKKMKPISWGGMHYRKDIGSKGLY